LRVVLFRHTLPRELLISLYRQFLPMWAQSQVTNITQVSASRSALLESKKTGHAANRASRMNLFLRRMSLV
jgi:hypothetical protein